MSGGIGTRIRRPWYFDQPTISASSPASFLTCFTSVPKIYLFLVTGVRLTIPSSVFFSQATIGRSLMKASVADFTSA